MSNYPYLEQRLRFQRIFNKNARLPETEEEIHDVFSSLVCELSPENLHCDGEASRSQVAQKLKSIRGAWRELESMLGRKVSEGEAETRLMKKIKAEINERK
jgi:hypothetical protein